MDRHSGCAVKTALFRRLGLATEGHCLHAGCRRRVADAGAVLRSASAGPVRRADPQDEEGQAEASWGRWTQQV
ncbi:DUF6420 family protein [Streptomyces sp. NPDC048045]|uniref:DUF6420 family protein n=1 Tax=Streptomyces sp. NPDC048045 TaxID=3154710 RepID=UPI00343F0913